jgi:hypothetical protein
MMDIDSSAWMGANRSAWTVAVVTTEFHYGVGSHSYLLTVVSDNITARENQNRKKVNIRSVEHAFLQARSEPTTSIA